MGEMIKFGIKLALTVACAGALVAAIAILYNLVTTFTSGNPLNSSVVIDLFKIISLFLPFRVHAVFTIITSLFSFKVAYWAADKMIQFINALV